MELPGFQSWVRWTKRSETPRCHRPGVYLLGRFDVAPPAIVDPTTPEIIYIGETCGQALVNRWYQFNNSAFLRRAGHSGGWTFSSIFCQDQVVEPFGWLYVASYPVEMDELRQAAHIRYIERLLLWRYVDLHGRLPACNRK